MSSETFKMEGFTFCNGKLVSHDVRIVDSEWKKEKDDPIYQSLLKNIGIGSINSMYINMNI